MIKMYANNLGWLAGRKPDGTIRFTKSKDAAKPYPSEWDKELIKDAREIEARGHHLDKVRC